MFDGLATILLHSCLHGSAVTEADIIARDA